MLASRHVDLRESAEERELAACQRGRRRRRSAVGAPGPPAAKAVFVAVTVPVRYVRRRAARRRQGASPRWCGRCSSSSTTALNLLTRGYTRAARRVLRGPGSAHPRHHGGVRRVAADRAAARHRAHSRAGPGRVLRRPRAPARHPARRHQRAGRLRSSGSSPDLDGIAMVYTLVGTSNEQGGVAGELRENIAQMTVRIEPPISREREDALIEQVRVRLEEEDRSPSAVSPSISASSSGSGRRARSGACGSSCR